ncbi:unnamed protein product, partial [Discosporangium mesarthrocarpum]
LPGGTDFVYEPNHEIYTRLDEYCNWDEMSESAAPLVITGPSGSGKSALLANWLLHYSRRLQQRPQQGGPLEEPLVFYHAVGCTRHGVNVNQLLWRLLGDIKQHFDLTRKVPHEAERLSWELPRFLELVGRKGHALIVIDGLHRVQDEKGGEVGLNWLPLRYPGNIRVIVSATDPNHQHLHLHHIQEQKRIASPAKLQGVSSDGSAFNPISTGPAAGVASVSVSMGGAGLLLESGQESEMPSEAEYESSHRRRKKVLTELHCRKWSTLEVGQLENWRKRDILEAFLLESALSGPKGGRGWVGGKGVEEEENGQTRLSPGEVTTAQPPGEEGSGDARGFDGLMLLPSMVDDIVASDATGSALYLRTLLRALEWTAMRGFDTQLVLPSLLKAQNVSSLYDVLFTSHPTEATTWAAEQAAKAAGGYSALVGSTFIDEGEGPVIKEGTKPMLWEGHRESNMKRITNPGQQVALMGSGSGELAPGVEKTDDKGKEEDLEKQEGKVGQGEDNKREEEESGYGDDTFEDYVHDDEFEGYGYDEGGTRYVVVEGGKDDEKGGKMDEKENTTSYPEESPEGFGSGASAGGMGLKQEVDDRGDPGKEGEMKPLVSSNQAEVNNRYGREVSGQGEESRSWKAKGEEIGGGSSTVKRAEDLSEVPLYLRGGKEVSWTLPLNLVAVEGFGTTLGRAMALLHIARHGLCYKELWALLASLRASQSAHEQAEGTEEKAEELLLRKILKNRNRLIDSIRAMDMDRDGTVSVGEFRDAIHGLGVEVTRAQVEVLIRSIDKDGDGQLDTHVGRPTGRHESAVRKERSDADERFTLDEGARENLQSALCVLGVTHMQFQDRQGDSVFVLGLEAEDLREVVSEQSIPAAPPPWHGDVT